MKAAVPSAQRKAAKKAAVPADAPAAPKPPAPGTTKGRLQVRQSGVHGKGVFALVPIKKGELILEYTGEVITWPEALRRHPHDPSQPDHTFYFHLSDELVIDGKVGGNASKWINHSCAPNVEADDESGQVYLLALRNIKAGDELFFDYGLVIDEPHTPELLRQYPCWCGAKACRGTLLAPQKKARAARKKPLEKPTATGKPQAKARKATRA